MSLSLASPAPWKVMIVDDDEVIHSITRLVLDDYKLYDRPLDFLIASSASDCKRLLNEHPDTALILLDVVMESDDAGLKLVDYIRNDLRNSFVRIILRTGQPGQAPEEKVIVEYDINDYKEKTELTSQKLFTAVTAALRSYHDIKTISDQRGSLEQIISSTMTLREQAGMQDLGNELLTGLSSIMRSAGVNQPELISGVFGVYADERLDKVNGFGEYATKELSQDNANMLMGLIEKGVQGDIGNGGYLGCCQVESSPLNFLYISGTEHLTDWQKKILELFCFSASLVVENFHLQRLVTA